MIVYSIPCSQAASERIWSIYDFLHSKRRNRLSANKTTKLVCLYVNEDVGENEANLVNVMIGLESDVGGSDEDGSVQD